MLARPFLPSLHFLAACTKAPTSESDTDMDTDAVDADADGADAGADCDDADPARYPDAAETCDGVDQDCDGTADDGPTDAPSWYADADADGYGDAAVATIACDAPAAAVADSSDCDDADDAVHPGAAEVCDDLDDDCDGTADDEAIAPTWYADNDGDVASTLAACEMPSGYTADMTDCDDARADAHPGGTEVCDGSNSDIGAYGGPGAAGC